MTRRAAIGNAAHRTRYNALPPGSGMRKKLFLGAASMRLEPCERLEAYDCLELYDCLTPYDCLAPYDCIIAAV